MNTTTHTLVQKLWNYCSVLRDGDDLFDQYRQALEKPGQDAEDLDSAALIEE
jgi:hypothetical protein